jgi:HEPN domain-containing protein
MKRSEVADKWWRQAEHDLQVAHDNAALGHSDTCAHMCQQAVELAVKALWIDAKQVDMPPRTHWVAQMASDLGAPKNVVESVNELVGDYIPSRYPDTGLGIPYEIYTAEDAADRLSKAEMVLTWIADQWEQTDAKSE